MKLKKTLLSLSLVAAMAVPSVSAFAAKNPAPGAPSVGATFASTPVPTTVTPLVAGVSTKTDVLDAIAQVQYLYDNTFYFEARRGLDQILTAVPGTALGSASAVPVATFWNMLTLSERGYVSALSEAIDDGIDRCILDEAFRDVEAYIANGYYAEANDILVRDVFGLLGAAGSTSSNLTGNELLYNAGRVFTTDDWDYARALDAQITGTTGFIIKTAADAEKYVRQYYRDAAGNEIPSWYNLYTVQVGTRFDVYLYYSVANGPTYSAGEIDINTDGVELLNTTVFSSVVGTPGEYNNPF